MKGNKKDFQSN